MIATIDYVPAETVSEAVLSDEELLKLLGDVPDKFTGLQVTLDPAKCREGIAFVGGVIANSPTLPILGCFELLSSESGMKTLVRGTDLDCTLTAVLPEMPDEPGVCVIPKKALTTEMKGKQPVFIKHTSETMADIRVNGFKRSVTTCPASVRVCHSEFKAERWAKMSLSKLKAAIKLVAAAQSKCESRYTLCGIHFEITMKTVKLVATDGRRLHVTEFETSVWDGGKDRIEGIIPFGSVKQILRIPDCNKFDEIKLSLQTHTTESTQGVTIRIEIELDYAGTYWLRTKLVDGNYPNYNNAIPNHKDTRLSAKVDADVFGEAVRKVASVCTDKENRVRFEFKDDNIHLKAGNKNANGVAELDVKASISGTKDPITIAFNPKYILDITDAYKGKKMAIGLIDDLSPGVFSSGATFAVLMPMRLDNGVTSNVR